MLQWGVEIDSKLLPSGFDTTKVEWFLRFLAENNERGGFFSKGDSDRIWTRHVLESARFVAEVQNYVSVSRETTVLDAGSGPGLPGFLFTCLQRPPRLTLNDSSKRRLGLLEQAVAEYDSRSEANDFPNVEFHYGRLEEMKGRFGVITSRALIPFPSVLRLICHLQRPGDLYCGFFNATDYSHFASQISDCGYSLPEVRPLQSPEGAVREIAFFRKEKVVRHGKPFAWKFIRSEMSQWQKS